MTTNHHKPQATNSQPGANQPGASSQRPPSSRQLLLRHPPRQQHPTTTTPTAAAILALQPTKAYDGPFRYLVFDTETLSIDHPLVYELAWQVWEATGDHHHHLDSKAYLIQEVWEHPSIADAYYSELHPLYRIATSGPAATGQPSTSHLPLGHHPTSQVPLGHLPSQPLEAEPSCHPTTPTEAIPSHHTLAPLATVLQELSHLTPSLHATYAYHAPFDHHALQYTIDQVAPSHPSPWHPTLPHLDLYPIASSAIPLLPSYQALPHQPTPRGLLPSNTTSWATWLASIGHHLHTPLHLATHDVAVEATLLQELTKRHLATLGREGRQEWTRAKI